MIRGVAVAGVLGAFLMATTQGRGFVLSAVDSFEKVQRKKACAELVAQAGLDVRGSFSCLPKLN